MSIEIPSREPKMHEKKCWPEGFEDLRAGKTLAQVRLNDEDYRAGDSIVFREYQPGEKDKRFEKERGDGMYTGCWVKSLIKHVVKDIPGLTSGYCVLSLGLDHNYSGFDKEYAGKYPLGNPA